ncbi:uncharacterized protein [Chelonus insularis]|uniref:uncharacterized protein n=1 Tax=Chelonus insularis TaxID=460826 RepID=UPI00158E3621|nr:uncharacterized protein LOC118064700 [Chelonus insularis]
MFNSVSYNHGSKVSARKQLRKKIFGGYSYVFSRRHQSTIYVVCVKKRTLNCKGTGKIKNNKFYSLNQHNHKANPMSKIIFDFERALRQKILKDKFKSLKSIYEEISLLYPQAAIIKTWVQMQPRMQYWKKQVQPSKPDSFQDYIDILNDPQWKFFTNNQDDNKMYVSTLQCGDMSHVTLYGNPQLLRQIETSHLLIDATFTVVPEKPKSHQLFTILALVNDSTIPILWVLMERKTILAYTKILQHLQTVLAPQLKPKIIISDFEVALAVSIKKIYPEADHTGCFFHYSQALIHKLKEMKLLTFILQWKNGLIIIKKFLALALLPPEKIQDAFEWLTINMPDVIQNHQEFQSFIKYYQNQWIRRTNPQVFSVFKKNIRTNNYSEAYNRVITQELGIHPSIWEFTYRINQLQQNALLEYQSLKLGHSIRRSMRNNNMMYEERVKELWNLYELDMLTIPQFLACASYDLRAFSRNKQDDKLEFLNPPNSKIVQEFDLKNTIFI